MSLDYLSESNDIGLYELMRMMNEARRSCVVICDKDQPIGIVTERDIVRVFHQQVRTGEFRDLAVAELMTTNPICTFADSDLYDALLLARIQRVRHLPVINDQQALVGLLTQTDMLEAYLAAWEKTAELEAANQHLKHLSLQDGLLGIGNRRSLNLDIQHLDASAKRAESPYVVAMIDVDFFKKYNDFYGHQKGDKALIAMVGALKQHMRESDRLYRYGGEELLILMPDTTIDAAAQAADRLRQAVFDLHVEHAQSEYQWLSVSVGVASSAEEHWKDVIKKADKALYRAKSLGRNTVALAEEENA